MTSSPSRFAALALLPLLLAGCYRPPTQQTQANRAIVADCRFSVDRAYAAQNRADLSRQDETNEPFAGQYVSGIVTSGLSQRYARDKAVDSCVRANGGPSNASNPGEGPTFSPGTQGTP